MVRNALAMMRLLNREVRDDPDAPRRRADQRENGDTIWGLRDGLVSENLQGVLDHQAAPAADPLADYDQPLPMDEGDESGLAEVPTRLTVLRVG